MTSMEDEPAYRPLIGENSGDLHDYASVSTNHEGSSGYDNSSSIHLDEFSGRKRAKRRWITVELIVVFMAAGFGGLATVKGQYLRQRVKLDIVNHTNSFNSSQSTCDMENGTKEIDNEIQALTSQWTLYLSIANTLPGLISTLFIGTLSERLGRRLAILTPCAGLLVSCTVCICVVQFELPLAVFVAGELISGLTGGVALHMAGCFSYIADITTEKQRMVRIVIIEMLVFGSIGAMQIAVGYLIRDLGFLTALWVPFAALSVSVVNATMPFLLVETIDTCTSHRGRLTEAIGDIARLCMINKDNRRWVLFAFFIITLFVGIVIQAGIAITVLYGQGQPFCWSSVIIGYYTSLSLILPGLGMITGAAIFPCCKMGNLWIMQISNVSGMANTLVLAVTYFFQSTQVIFASTFIGVFKLLGVPVIRTTLSSLVDEHEHGALFAALGVVDGLGMFLSPIIMNAIYTATVKVMSTMVFFIMSALMVVPILVVGSLQFQAFHKKRVEQYLSINIAEEDKQSLLPD